MPKIHRDVENRIKEIWAEEPTLSGQDVWNQLKQEPIKCPSLRKVQQIIGSAKRNHVSTEPEVLIKPWQHDWFEDPDKAKTLLLMHYTKSIHGGSALTEREAKWGLRIVRFFDLLSPDEDRSFLEMAEKYANRERLALTLNSPLDTTKLDEMLLARSDISSIVGSPKNKESAIDETESEPRASGVDQAEIGESQETAREFTSAQFPDSTMGFSRSPTDVVPGLQTTVSPDLVELWQQIDCELALIDRQRFNAISFGRTSDEPNWYCSNEKAILDAREKEIQTMADRLFTTPEGRAAHERFIRDTNSPVRIQVSDVPKY